MTLESEHSMITAAAAAAATGVRVFTATSSQGLLYAHGDALHRGRLARAVRAGERVARRWRRPITLEPDHTDILAARDSGFLQIHCATCQEVLDSVLIAYRLAEDARVRLPVIVNLDGFYLSFTREPVEIPDAEAVRRVPAALRSARTSSSAPASPSARRWRCWAARRIRTSATRRTWRRCRR